jgi:uncharacterized protein (TIGR02118 family)
MPLDAIDFKMRFLSLETSMIRVTVSYPVQPDSKFDLDYYQTKHAALVRSQLEPHGMRRFEIDKVLSDGQGKPASVLVTANMLFDDMQAFKAAMAAGGKAMAMDARNYTDIAPTMLISEVLFIS